MNGAGTHEPLADRRALGWGLVALGLVTIVAMAAHGASWSDERGGRLRSLPHAVTFAAGVVAFVLAIALFTLSTARARRFETAEQRRKRWSVAIGFLVVIALISLVRVIARPSDARPTGSRDSQGQSSSSGSGSGGGGNGTETWWPLVMVGLGTAAALVAATARRRVVDAADPDSDSATRAMLDASLDDLRREPDARRAVVAAYARMEGGLAARGFARDPSETPTEYLARARSSGSDGPLASVPVAVDALAELTTLAERARFSSLPVDETMRSDAIDALERLRRDLRPETDADLSRSV